MSKKNHRLCLDACDGQPKLIKDLDVFDLHEKHDYQTIEEIQNRINRKDYKKTVDEFLTINNLDNLLSQNDIIKDGIIKDFAQKLNQIFNRINRSITNIYNSELTENRVRNTKIADVINSIIPEYSENLLSQCEGNFSFLKENNFYQKLKDFLLDKRERIVKAQSEIQDLQSVISKIFRQFNISPVQFDKMQEEEEIYLNLYMPDGEQTLELPKNTTFQELSEYFMDEKDIKDQSLLGYVFFKDQKKTKKCDPNKTLDQENILDNSNIYGFPLDFEEPYTITIVMPKADPQTLDLQSDTTFTELSDYFVDLYGENSDQVSYNFFNDQKKRQKYDPTQTIKEEKIKNYQTIYGHYNTIKQDKLKQRETKIEQERIRLKQQEEEEEEINLILFISDRVQSLELAKNTTFQELSEYFMDEKDIKDQSLLGYVFFKDQKKTKKCDPNKTLNQENIQDNSIIYGEEKRSELKFRNQVNDDF